MANSSEQIVTQGSRKWRAVLLLAILYGIGIVLKFSLVVIKAPTEAIASFDDTLRWAMAGLSAAVSTFNLAIGLEDYAKNRGPTNTTQTQQADAIVNAPTTPVAVVTGEAKK